MRSKLLYRTTPGHIYMLIATMAYVCAAFTVCVIIFSTGGKFRLVSNFSELHALSLAAHSYALLLVHIIVLMHIGGFFLPMIVCLTVSGDKCTVIKSLGERMHACIKIHIY